MNYNIINITCSHENSDPHPPYQCDIISDVIIKALNNNYKLDKNKILTYIDKLFTNTYYRDISCVIFNKEKIKTLMNNIFEFMPMIFLEMCGKNNKIFSNMLRFPFYDTCYEHLNKNINLNNNNTVQMFLSIITVRLSSNYIINNDLLANFIIKHVNMTINVIIKLVTCKSDVLSQYIANIIDKSNEDFSFDDIILKSCSALPYSKAIIQSLVFKNFPITNDHLTRVILHCNSADSIDFMFELSGIKPTKIHYKHLLTATKEQEIDIDKRHTTIYKKVHVMLNTSYTMYRTGNVPSYTPEKMEVLIKHGFIPDIEDIHLSITSNKEIYNIERFGIALDEKFLKLCQENNFYPNYNFKCVDQNLYKLQELCLKKNLPKIKQLFNKNKIVPDNVCLENASKVPNNKGTLETLVNAGGIITKSCLISYADTIHDNQLTFLMQEYFKNDAK